MATRPIALAFLSFIVTPTLTGQQPTPPAYLVDIATESLRPDNPLFDQPDGLVTAIDLQRFVEFYNAEDPRADVTTTGTRPGDAGYLEPDGVIDQTDIDLFTSLWADPFPGDDTFSPGFERVTYEWTGRAVLEAAQDLFAVGNARIVFVGDSFSSVTNARGSDRLPLAFAFGSHFGGLGRITAVSAAYWFNQNLSPIPADGQPLSVTSEALSMGEPLYNAASFRPFRLSGPQSTLWDAFGIPGSSPSIWQPVVSGRPGALVDYTDALSTNAVEFIRSELSIRDTISARKPAVDDILMPRENEELAVRLTGPRAQDPLGEDLRLYAIDCGGNGPRTTIALDRGDRFGWFAPAGAHHAAGAGTAPWSEALDYPASFASPFKWTRYVLGGPGVNAQGDLRLRRTSTDGNPVWALRGEREPWLNAADGGWWSIGTQVFYITDPQGRPAEGIFLDGPLGVASANYPELYTDPANLISSPGQKNMGPRKLRDYLWSTKLRPDRPLIVFVHFAAEARPNLRTRVTQVLNAVQFANTDEQGARLEGDVAPVRIIFVVPFAHTISGDASHEVIRGTMLDTTEAVAQAVALFNLSAPAGFSAGAINLYDTTRGQIFGDRQRFGTDNNDAAIRWLRANGFERAAQATNGVLLDGVDLHLNAVTAAQPIAETMELIMRRAAGLEE